MIVLTISRCVLISSSGVRYVASNSFRDNSSAVGIRKTLVLVEKRTVDDDIANVELWLDVVGSDKYDEWELKVDEWWGCSCTTLASEY